MDLKNISMLKKVLLAFIASLITVAAFAQSITVKGKVIDEDGAPLSGVFVLIKGSTTGVMTDPDGHYTISVKSKDILLFSFLGMIGQEIPINGRSTIDVTLMNDTSYLEEVVVVGYGSQTKMSLTGSVSRVNGDELLKSPATNVSSLLGGRVTGVASVQESGEPGADNAALSIRGSRYGATYIVDGVPRSIDGIDPNEISSISVLKDASAAAVYGLQSAGGVIIITTKKGEAGKSKINYKGSYGLSMNANFPEFMDGPTFAWYYNKGLEMDGYPIIFTKNHLDLMTNGDDSDGWGNTNWIKETFGIGVNKNHTFSVEGGNKQARYFVSIGYLGQEGNIKGYLYDRYNLRSSIDGNINENLKFNLNIAGQAGERKTPLFSSGGTESEGTWMSVARQAVQAHPYLPKMYDGLPVASPATVLGQPVNPLAAVEKSGYYKNPAAFLQTTATLEWSVPWIKGLTLKASGAYDKTYSTTKIFSTPYYVMLASLPTSTNPDISYTKVLDVRNTSYNTLGEGLFTSTQMVGTGSIGYVNTFADKHSVDLMLLTEIRQLKYHGFGAYGKNVGFVELPELGFATPADSPINGYSNMTRNLGFVTRLKYDFSAKYFFEFTGRYDGSYKFSGNVQGKRWGFFPAASVGWRVSEESFMKWSKNWLTNLKVRFSGGELGSDNIGAYSFLNTYSTGGVLYRNGNRYNTLYASAIANPNLTWERSRQYNVGLNASLWRGLLDIEMDAFYNYNYDILTYMGANYPSSMGGYYPSIENYSSVDSKGVEFMVSHTNTIGSGINKVSYKVAFNATYATSRWIRYPDSPNAPSYQKMTGNEYGLGLGWKTNGLFRSEEEIDRSPWMFGQRPRVGDIKYVDVNGDGEVEYQDKVFIGRPNRPKLVGGLNLGMSWRGFDLFALITGGALFDISLTGTYFNGMDDNTIFTQTFKEGGNSPLYLVQGAWRPDNPKGTYPRLTVNAPDNNNGCASTFWYRDGKYLRLKSAQIGYSLPKKWVEAVKLQGLRIFVEGSNLYTLSGLPKGIDPELPGVNNGYYPQQMTVVGGISITL